MRGVPRVVHPRAKRDMGRMKRVLSLGGNHYGSHSLRGTEVAATLYSLVESAKLNSLEPRFYFRVAVHEGRRHETVPLPHEVKAMLAHGRSIRPTTTMTSKES